MATIPPAEILEASYPVMFTQWALRPDSAGAGRHRGGLGAIYEIEALDEGGADVFLLGERGKFRALRRQRRQAGGANRFIYANRRRRAHAAAGLEGHRRAESVVASACGWKRRAAAVSAIRSTRDPARVARDVRLGYISREAARRDYGVALQEDGGIDEPATAALRSGVGA